MKGISQLIDCIKLIQEAYNPDLFINGVIYNKHKAMTKYRKFCADNLSVICGLTEEKDVYRSKISDSVEISATTVFAKNVLGFTHKEKLIKEFTALGEEFIERIQIKERI